MQEKYNDNQQKVTELMHFEETDAEELLNEIDLEFECHFDQNLQLGRRKTSSNLASFYMDSNNLNMSKLNNSQSFLMPNKKLGDNNYKQLEVDYYDKIPGNCCLLEIFPIWDNSGCGVEGKAGPKDTIFVGTYDGHLFAMRMAIKLEGQMESYTLNTLKKWTFSNPIQSLIFFDFYNYLNDEAVKLPSSGAPSSTKFGRGLKSTKSVSSGLNKFSGLNNSNQTFQSTITIGSGTNSKIPQLGSSKKRKSVQPNLDTQSQQSFHEFLLQANQQLN